jgi:hypothetical protein
MTEKLRYAIDAVLQSANEFTDDLTCVDHEAIDALQEAFEEINS